MVERRGHVDLAHKATQGLISDGNFRQQGFDGDRPARLFIPRQHHASHAAPPKHLDHLVAGDGLRLTLQLFTTLFTDKRHRLVRG